MTKSIVPASMVIAVVLRWSTAVVGVGPGGVTARQDCDGSRPRADRLLIRPAFGGPGRRRQPGRQVHPKARPRAANDSFGSALVADASLPAVHPGPLGDRRCEAHATLGGIGRQLQTKAHIPVANETLGQLPLSSFVWRHAP